MSESLDDNGRVVVTVGRIVHYHHPEDGVVVPALVVAVPDDLAANGTIHLAVFRMGALEWKYNVAEGTNPGMWRWPPRP